MRLVAYTNDATVDKVWYNFNMKGLSWQPPKMKRPRSKYGNKVVEYKGEKYQSKKEGLYAQQLDFLKKATDPHERVVSWERQVPFLVEVNGQKICKYLADFRVHYADGRTEIVDVKGMRTEVYKLKKKLVEALFGVVIIEV